MGLLYTDKQGGRLLYSANNQGHYIQLNEEDSFLIWIVPVIIDEQSQDAAIKKDNTVLHLLHPVSIFLLRPEEGLA